MTDDASTLFTVTAHDALKLLPSVVVAIIIVLPAFKAVTRPSWSTLATLGSLDDQATVLLVVSSGNTVAASCKDCPIVITAAD